MRSDNRILYFVAIAALALSVYNTLFMASHPASAQNDMFLSRRIDQVEQRFYSLESRLNRLESVRPAVSSPTIADTNNIELQFLRTQLDGLRTRVGELECGVLRLDERTTVPARRMKSSEPCRRDPAAVVQLSARP